MRGYRKATKARGSLLGLFLTYRTAPPDHTPLTPPAPLNMCREFRQNLFITYMKAYQKVLEYVLPLFSSSVGNKKASLT